MRRRSEIESVKDKPEPEVDHPVDRSALRMPEAALKRYAEFHPGDQLSITIGAEKYSPVKYRSFDVGPFSATVVVRPDETGADAAMRCYRVLLELNEAEFQIAWQRHRERLTKVGSRD